MRKMACPFVLDAEVEVAATRTTEEIMKNTPRVYLLTLEAGKDAMKKCRGS